jgi:hypothetical protein
VAKGLQGINKMTNMSANILREIVSRTFNVNPKQVILSGELKHEESWKNNYHDGSMGSNEDVYKLYGYNHKDGFIDLSNHVGSKSASNYAHSDSYDRDGTKLCDIQGIEKYIFLVVRNEGHDHWSGSMQEDWDKTYLYKLPSFTEYWQKIETEDLKRWEKFLND